MPQKKRLIYIAPIQCGIIFGIFGAILGIFLGCYFALSGLGSITSIPRDGEKAITISAGVGALDIVAITLIYIVSGFIIGTIGGLIYNLITKFTGGLVVKFSE